MTVVGLARSGARGRRRKRVQPVVFSEDQPAIVRWGKGLESIAVANDEAHAKPTLWQRVKAWFRGR